MADKDYIVILRESLERKVRVLGEIIRRNEEQEEILEDNNSLPEEFEANVDAKAELIDEINRLDDGFEGLFSQVEKELTANKAAYANEIRRMQELIREITKLSTHIQVQEKQNYNLATVRFSNIKKNVKKIRQSQKTVNNYYKSMVSTGYYDPQFLDSKK